MDVELVVSFRYTKASEMEWKISYPVVIETLFLHI